MLTIRPIHVKYIKSSFLILDAILNRGPINKSKELIFDFCAVYLG